MSTLVRRLSTTFTTPVGLRYLTPSQPSLAGVADNTLLRRYTAPQAFTTYAAGDPVSSIANLGSGSGAMAASGTTRPTLGVDTTGSVARPYLSFDGVDDAMSVGGTGDAIGTGAFTMFAVCRHPSGYPAASTAFWGAAAYGPTSGIAVGNVSNTGLTIAYRGSTFTGTAIGAVGAGWRIYVIVYNGSSSVMRLDNKAELTGNPNTADLASQPFVLGSRGGSVPTYPKVDVIEAGAYSGALDTTERTALVAALATGYGITPDS